MEVLICVVLGEGIIVLLLIILLLAQSLSERYLENYYKNQMEHYKENCDYLTKKLRKYEGNKEQKC